MSELVVKTKQGFVEGIEADGVREFLGVPYAQPPVGKLRFQRPAEKKKWTGVRPCKTFGAQAFQPDLSAMPLYGKEFYQGTPAPMSEDCLYLNIWATDGAEKLPVFIYIHGGGFDHGCGSEVEFLGGGFAKKGVICVTINYRVGALGFFAHDGLEKDGIPSGNYGLWDQIAAIKWVKENIAAFGGDGEKITVAGQSAGCMSLQALCCSDYSENLISGAILQSAGGLPGFNRGGDMAAQKEKSLELMKNLGVNTLDEMYELSAEDIAFAGLEMNAKQGMCWLPCIDGDLLKNSVMNLTQAGKILNIPYIIGSTADEMGNGTRELLRESAKGFAKRMNELGRKPVYVYHFERKLPGDDAGAFHSSELWYEFATLENCWRPAEDIDRQIEYNMNTSFAQFIKTGVPDGEKLPVWNAYKTDDDIMIFG